MAEASVRIVFSGDAGSATRAVKGLEGSFLSLGKIMKTALAVGGGVMIARGLREAGKAALSFDKSMRNVNSIAKLSESQFQSLSAQVLKLAGPTAQAPTLLADGLYDIVSSGFKAQDAVKILAVSAKAATAGLTDTATATKAVTAVLNAYNLKAEDARAVSDVLFQTVNKGVLTFEELSTSIGDVLPFASQLGVPLEEVGGAMATMTLQGLSAAESSTRLKGVLVQMLKPNADLSAAISKLGFASGEAMVKQLGLVETVRRLDTAAKGNKETIASWMSDIRAIGGFLALSGDQMKRFEAITRSMDAASAGAGATAKAFAEQSKSLSFQWDRAKASLAAAAIPIVQLLFPALVKGADVVSRFASSVSTNMPRIKQQFGDIAGVVKDVGSALFGFAKSDIGVSLGAAALAMTGVTQAAGSASRAVQSLAGIGIGGWAFAGVAAVGLLAGALVYLAQQSSLAEQEIAAVEAALNSLKGAGDDARAATDANTQAQAAYANAQLGVKQALRDRELVEQAIAAKEITGRDAALALEGAQLRVRDAYAARTAAMNRAREASSQMTAAQQREQEEARRAQEEVGGLVRAFQRVRDVISQAEQTRAAGGFVDPRALAILRDAAPAVDEYARALEGAQAAAQKLAADPSATELGRKTAAGIDKALGALRAYVKQTGQIPTRLQTETILKDNGVPGKIRGIIMDMLGFPKTLRTTIEMREQAKGRIKEINTELDTLKKQRPTVEIAAKIGRLEAARSQLKALIDDAKAAGKQPTEIRLKLLNDQFDSAMRKSKGALKDMGSTIAKPRILIENGPALAAITDVQSALAGLDNINRTITYTYRVSGRPPASRAGGGFIPGPDTGGRDSVPALLAPGEVVLNRSQQLAFGGPQVFKRLFGFDTAGVPGMAGGGFVQSFAGGGFVSASQAGKALQSIIKRDKKNSGYKAKSKAVTQLAKRLDANRTRQDNLARSIGQDSREFDISVEEFIRVDADGNETLDTGAVAQRVSEIDRLIGRYNELLATVDEETAILKALIAALEAAIKAWQAEIRDQERVIRETTALIKDATAKMNAATDPAVKNSYQAVITRAETTRDNARSKIEELRGNISQARDDRGGYQKDRGAQQYDRRDVELDVKELTQEKADTLAIRARPPEPTSAADESAASAAGAEGFGGGGGVADDAAAKENAFLKALNDELRRIVGQLKLALGIERAQLPVIASFQRGTLQVPQTGPYMLHGGEQVVPAGFRRAGGDGATLPELRVIVNVANGMEWLEQFISVKVEAGSGQLARRIGREADRMHRAGEARLLNSLSRRQ